MDDFKEYRKIRIRLESVAFIIAYIVGDMIASYLGLTGKKFFSLDTGMHLTIIIGIGFVLNIVAIRIADNWYEKNKTQ